MYESIFIYARSARAYVAKFKNITFSTQKYITKYLVNLKSFFIFDRLVKPIS